jgi:hypothetical protein
MTMTKIAANFSNGGTMKRNTGKNYTHAWQVRWRRPLNEEGKPVDSFGNAVGEPIGGEGGFASSQELAAKAAASVANRIRNLPGRYGSKYEVFEEEVAAVEVVGQ